MSEPSLREIELNGATYQMAPITLNDLVAIEEQGIEQETMAGIRYLLHLSLVKNQPQLTPEQVGELVTMDNINLVNEALVGSLTAEDDQGKVPTA
tara:strand:- start:812 stop:1096 length:285 start_codon:yes stop_codon:yes gene_type:complete